MTNFTIWIKNFNYERRRKMFERMEMDPKTGVGVMIQNRAMEMAMRMVMNWLDKKRIIHCAFCPATETLRRMEKVYYCTSHYSSVRIQLQKKDAKAKEPVAA